jgi:hypothetical protein
MSMVFKTIKTNKTIITITGKYGERGYSFTSDYYNNDNKYVLHLTDQYYVSHSKFNCTDIFQKGRIQGKYTDKPILTFWTTHRLIDVINQYVDFMTKIENKIMTLQRGHEYIQNLCECTLIHKNFLSTLGTTKQRKNIKYEHIKYDKNFNGMIYFFDPKINVEEYENNFMNWCLHNDIIFNGFINEIQTMTKHNYVQKYGVYKEQVLFYKLNDVVLDNVNEIIENHCNEFNIEHTIKTKKWIENRMNKKKNNVWYDTIRGTWKKCTKKDIIDNASEGTVKEYRRWTLCYDDHDNVLLSVRFRSNMHKKMPKSSDNILCEHNWCDVDNIIKYSKLNHKFINNMLNSKVCDSLSDTDIDIINNKSYFFLSPDGYVYHHDKHKSIINSSIKINSNKKMCSNDDDVIVVKKKSKKKCNNDDDVIVVKKKIKKKCNNNHGDDNNKNDNDMYNILKNIDFAFSEITFCVVNGNEMTNVNFANVIEYVYNAIDNKHHIMKHASILIKTKITDGYKYVKKHNFNFHRVNAKRSFHEIVKQCDLNNVNAHIEIALKNNKTLCYTKNNVTIL